MSNFCFAWSRSGPPCTHLQAQPPTWKLWSIPQLKENDSLNMVQVIMAMVEMFLELVVELLDLGLDMILNFQTFPI